MTAQRWTVRGVPDEAKENIRRGCNNTGLGTGELLTQAISAWAERNPKAVEECPEDDPDDLLRSIMELQRILAEQTRLLAQLGQHVLIDPTDLVYSRRCE